MKTGEVAKRIGVSENSVRNWANEFGEEFLSKLGRGGNRRTRRFDEEDVLVLATIADRRKIGLTYDNIRDLLRDEQRVEEVPPLPDPDEEDARHRVQLVPLPELQKWQFQVEHLRSELQRIAELHQAELDRMGKERDTAITDLSDATKRIAELEREAGILQGRIQEMDKKRGLFR